MAKRIGDIPAYDRPREKLLRNGAAVLSDQELLAVLLGKGTSGVDVMTLAAKLAKVIDAKGLAVRADDLRGFDGVGDAKATLILAALEFARRRIKPEGVKVHTPADLLPHVRHYADLGDCIRPAGHHARQHLYRFRALRPALHHH